MKNRSVPVWLAGVLLLGLVSCAPEEPEGASAVAPFAPPASVPGLVPVAQGWAQTSINAVIFRKNALVTHQDTQYVAFYSNDAALMLGKRRLGTTAWEIHQTQYQGNVRDAHHAISIAVDGAGLLHVAWDHHGHPLRYSQGVRPGTLELTDEMPMIGSKEEQVTYPEFYTLPNGDLLFLYRDGRSGSGNLMINRYEVATGTWRRVQEGLLDGQGQRNAYWQVAVDPQGSVHLSWVWRETSDVATNHDLGYAKSTDGGLTWQTSTGELYATPITAGNAEYAARIPQNSELINQTSMTTDASGRPYIATYWRPAGTDVPQFHLVYHDGRLWQTSQVSRRTTPFRLSGGGTRRIPVSRPQLMVATSAGVTKAYMVFRDVERGERVSVAISDDLGEGSWRMVDLTDAPVGAWEPTYDTALWQREQVLHLFHQVVDQPDGDDRGTFPETPLARLISVLEWKP